jgi:predicted nuclease of predicted toxin-antitoxin system
MPVALYMDEHIPRNITDELRRREVDVLTIQEDGLAGVSDPDILDRAAELKRVVVTFDDDFLRESSRRMRQDIGFYGVIHVNPNDISIGKIIEDLEIVAKAMDPTDFTDRKIEYLPL